MLDSQSAHPCVAAPRSVRKDRPVSRPAGELWLGAIKRGLECHYPDVLLAVCEPERTLCATSGQRAATNRVTPRFVLRAEACSQAAPGTGADQYVYLPLFGRASACALPAFCGLLRSAQLAVGRRHLHFRFEQLGCFLTAARVGRCGASDRCGRVRRLALDVRTRRPPPRCAERPHVFRTETHFAAAAQGQQAAGHSRAGAAGARRLT